MRGGMRVGGLVLGAALLVVLASAPSWAATATRVSAFEYDAVTGLLSKEIVEPDTTQLRLETTYTRDAFGNKTAVTVSSPATGTAAIETRTSTTTFDSNGRFATASANALGHSETRVFDTRYGGVTSLTGPNGLTTTWEYDGFGRKTLETRADGTKTKWEYLYCNGVAGGTATCPTHGKYLIVVTPLNSSNAQNGPLVKTYHDALNREIRQETQGFDGTAIYVDTQYDSVGRVQQKSRPYFAAGTAEWVQFTYDAIGRVTQETHPDASYTQFGYAGLVTSATNSMNQTRTKTKNSQGQVIQSKDELNQTTSFAYDPFGNLTTTIDAAGNVTTLTYDTRGRKVAMSDPNLGAWSYVYDALGQLVSQTDAKSQTTTMAYDKLGRMVSRTEPDLASAWVYDTAVKGIGKLTSASAGTVYLRTHSYDTLGRPAQTDITIDTATYTTATSYDSQGRVDTVSYPSGFQVQHTYTALGYLQSVRNAQTSSTVYWQATAMNAERQLTAFQQGNGIQTTQAFNPQTGRLEAIQAGASNSIQNLSYQWDTLGNLLSRTDATQSPAVTDEFSYDALNRLTEAAVVDGPVKTYAYDSIGNITSKSDTGTYSYPTPGPSAVRPHAVTSVTGALNATYAYDANGNLTSGAGRTVTWMSFNMVATVQRGTNTLGFTYDSEHQRIKQYVSGTGETTIYVNAEVRVEKVLDSGGNLIRWNNYIYAAGGMVAVQYDHATAADQTRYFHKDHLGSISVITDEAGTVVERLSYDAWGMRRFLNGADDLSETLGSSTDRGFTGHEHLQEVGLVHMNGRIYDPRLGRFMSADPFIQDPFNTQSLNRYSYVINNPLCYTDPNGYFFKSIVNAIKNIISNPRAIIAIAVVVVFQQYQFLPALAPSLGLTAAVTNGIVGGALAGAISGGTVKSTLTGAVAGGIFGGVGDIAADMGWANGSLEKVALHAGAGGVSSAVQGGDFKSGFIAAGFTQLIGPAIPDLGTAGNVVARAVLGGAAAAAAGGRFENGAVTAAFAYLFNELAHYGNAGAAQARIMYGDDSAVAWPTDHSTVTSPYGDRGGMLHNGADIRARAGEAVYATQNGEVTNIYYDDRGGNQILIRNADGSVSGYAHTRATNALAVGSRTYVGTQIGTSDGSGFLRGGRPVPPHLHYTYRPGGMADRTVDPISTQLRNAPRPAQQ